MPTVNSIALMESKPFSQVYAASFFYSQECIFNDITAEKLLAFYLEIPDKGNDDPSNLIAFKKGKLGSHFSEIYYKNWKASNGELVTKVLEKNKHGRLPDFEDQYGKEIEVKLLNIHNDHKLHSSVAEFEAGKGKDINKLFKDIVTKSRPFEKALNCSEEETIIALDCCILVDLCKFYGYSEEEILGSFLSFLNGKYSPGTFEVFCTK